MYFFFSKSRQVKLGKSFSVLHVRTQVLLYWQRNWKIIEDCVYSSYCFFLFNPVFSSKHKDWEIKVENLKSLVKTQFTIVSEVSESFFYLIEKCFKISTGMENRYFSFMPSLVISINKVEKQKHKCTYFPFSVNFFVHINISFNKSIGNTIEYKWIEQEKNYRIQYIALFVSDKCLILILSRIFFKNCESYIVFSFCHSLFNQSVFYLSFHQPNLSVMTRWQSRLSLFGSIYYSLQISFIVFHLVA